MAMIHDLYCRLVEYGCGYLHEYDDHGTITSRRPGSRQQLTISNTDGRVSVRISDGQPRLIANDRHAVDTIVELLDDL